MNPIAIVPRCALVAFSVRLRRLAAVLLFVAAVCALPLRAQTVPSTQGTALPDPAIPVMISPSPASSGFFVLNQDVSLLMHSTVDSSQNESCAAPTGFSVSSTAPITLVNDLYNAYVTGPDASGLNPALVAIQPEVGCQDTATFHFTGGLPKQTLALNSPRSAHYYFLSAYGGSGTDTLNVMDDLNRGTVAVNEAFTAGTQISLDSNATYTAMVDDESSVFTDVAITELKTSTSPGNLWIYDPILGQVFKILGPGGTPLPAVSAFIIPAKNYNYGNLLVLVNQDGLTSSNLTNPPQDTTPFTLIDLGQLRTLFVTATSNTITLPFVQQVTATQQFYAMLGAAYNPIDHHAYAVVAGGTSLASVTESVISYDLLNPSSPGETVVATVSNIPFSFGAYPQIAMNAASGTMQVLTPNPRAVYTVGITGTNNTALQLDGTPFPDAAFQPTWIAANPLMGETYIASASGQVDILTRPAIDQGGITLTLSGLDTASTSDTYSMNVLVLAPVYDPTLSTTPMTITATPLAGGAATTVFTGNLGDYLYPGGYLPAITFPGPGQYILQGSAPASANYPAVTSPPVEVTVGNYAGVYPTTTTMSVPSNPTSGAFNATVTVSGTTYAPTGEVYVQDQTGAEVGNVPLRDGVIHNPIIVPVTTGGGSQTLTATYSGDDQNKPSTSAPQTITVGAPQQANVTLATTLNPTTVTAGSTVSGTVKLTATSTNTPTGVVTIYQAPSGSSIPTSVTTVPAWQAFSAGGASFSYTAPAAGTYTVAAGYNGDINFYGGYSNSVILTVNPGAKTPTTTTLSAPTLATAAANFNVTVALNFSGSTNTPTGNIVLTATPTAGGAATTLATITAAQSLASGGYTASVSLSTQGTYTLTASYAGDTNFDISNATASINIRAIPTTTTISAPATASAATNFNVTMALKFTSSTNTPTGSVVLTATPTTGGATTTLATITAALALQSAGYTAAVSLPTQGTYTLDASYTGDTNFDISSARADINITAPTKITPTLAISTLPAVVLPGQSFPATISFTAPGSSTKPTGNILITATGVNSKVVTNLGSVDAGAAFASGGVNTSISLPPGDSDFQVQATYAGDNLYLAASNSGVYVNEEELIVTGPATAQATVNAPFVVKLEGTQNALVGLNVNVTSVLAGGASGPSTTVPATSAFGAGTSTNLVFPSAGTYTVTASFAGDGIDPAVTSSAVTITVGPAPTNTNFSFTQTSGDMVDITSNNTTPGIESTTLTATNGYSTPVTFSILCDGSPSMPAGVVVKIVDHVTGKTITQATPTPAGTAVDFVFEYTTGTYTMQLQRHGGVYFAFLLGGLALIGMRRKSPRARKACMLLIAVVCVAGSAILVSGCGSNVSTNMSVTATPINSNSGAAPQTIQFGMSYDQHYTE